VSRAKKLLCITTLVASGCLAATGSAAASGCADTQVLANALSQDQMESSIACLINEERSSRSLAPLRVNDDLRRAALAHSNDMVERGYFDHTSPSGVTFTDRIEATGYMHNARSWSVGENLIWGSGPLSTPQALVAGWMNSPPHRENILGSSFREIGIAAVLGTPESKRDTSGVTVSSEYGYRTTAKKKRRGKARKAKRRHAAKR
jgi:uncharacterized protein YkwD